MKVYFNTKTFEHHYSELDVTRNAAEAELLVMGAKTVTVEDFTILKAIYRFGVGIENIPFEYAQARNIPVFFPSEKTKEILFDSTANFASYLIFQMHYGHCLGNPAKWEKQARDYLGHKKLLVIGMGNIGKRISKKMSPYMHIMEYDVRTNPMSELHNLISSADYISLHIPLTPENRDFINGEKLSWMKDDVVLINTSRGALVNEESLYDRLMRTDMRAAFDVFWIEPYKGKLTTLSPEKFFMTPHSASQTKEFVENSFLEILDITKGNESE